MKLENTEVVGGIQAKVYEGTDGRTGGEHTEVGEERHSLPKTRNTAGGWLDTGADGSRSALRKDKEAPSKAGQGISGHGCSCYAAHASMVICYMCNELTDAWERKYRICRKCWCYAMCCTPLKGHALRTRDDKQGMRLFFRKDATSCMARLSV